MLVHARLWGSLDIAWCHIWSPFSLSFLFLLFFPFILPSDERMGLGLGLGLGFLLPSDEWTNVVSLTALEDHIIAVKTILANLSLGTTD